MKFDRVVLQGRCIGLFGLPIYSVSTVNLVTQISRLKRVGHLLPG